MRLLTGWRAWIHDAHINMRDPVRPCVCTHNISSMRVTFAEVNVKVNTNVNVHTLQEALPSHSMRDIWAWMGQPGWTVRDLQDQLRILIKEIEDRGLPEHTAPRLDYGDCTAHPELHPVRVYKDSEGGNCIQICQWEPKGPKPNHFRSSEALARLLDVNVRIGSNSFRFKFSGISSDTTVPYYFTQPPLFHRVRVIGQGGFGRVWECQVRFRPHLVI